MHSIGILVCLVVIVSANSVHGQLAQPYQYAPQQYQNAFNQDYRRYNAPYSGYSAASSSPYGSGSIVFPDDTNLNTRHKKDMNRLENRHNEHTPMADEVSGLMKLCNFIDILVGLFLIGQLQKHENKFFKYFSSGNNYNCNDSIVMIHQCSFV